MQSHRDQDAARRNEFLKTLEEKAEKLSLSGSSNIAGGEDIIAEWKSHDVSVRQLQPDELGVLRISIGGGPDTPVILNYCAFRGDRGKCMDLLRRALRALENSPNG